jgi:hypothetical protein
MVQKTIMYPIYLTILTIQGNPEEKIIIQS